MDKQSAGEAPCPGVAKDSHCALVSISKRLWDVARANISGFSEAFRSDDDGLTAQERAEVEREMQEQDNPGARAGRSARRVADAAEAAWERAYQAAQERASAGGYKRPGMSMREQREQWFRTLELDPSADYASVRKSYRRLVAKYHPDRHAGDPERYKAATEVSRRITEAYDGLRDHFERGGAGA